MRRCEACGADLGDRPKARFCGSTCRSRYRRGYRAPAEVVELSKAPEPVEQLPSLEQVAWMLAARMTSPLTPATASAGLVREYRAILSEIEATRPKAKDGIDEIAERRARRLG